MPVRRRGTRKSRAPKRASLNSNASYNNEKVKNQNSESKNNYTFRRDPFSELIQSKLVFAFLFLLVALFCDVFLAKPILQQKGITEVQLFQELMQKATGVNFENTFRFINASIPSGSNVDANLRPGYLLSQQGSKAKYPVVLVPGFITSGLELWQGEECAKRHFRQRLWGSLPIFVQSFLTDMQCWSRHLALDPISGMDPPNIKLRSAQGFEAADYFMSTYWVWDKVIENLSDVGYDSTNMIMMSYDWRLRFDMLEERDGYFTKLKMNIEALVKTQKSPVVLTSHSMGSQIVLYFFKWVTTDESLGGGGGGSDWIDHHILKFVNIAGPLLGVPKAVPALLSGEMKDTAALLGPMGMMVERVFGRKERRKLWNTWGSLYEMLPKGGDSVWGNGADIITGETPQEQRNLSSKFHGSSLLGALDYHTCNEKDKTCSLDSMEEEMSLSNYETSMSKGSSFITFTEDLMTHENESDHQELSSKSDIEKEWDISNVLEYLRVSGGGYGPDLHSIGAIHPQNSRKKWSDPLETPLPHAPNMKIYCLYGVGIETERAYFYRNKGMVSETSDSNELPYLLDASINEPESHIHFGVKSSDGDVSVPLVSLGYMCVDRWKTKKLNPSNIQITTREYMHKEEFQVNDPMRGGPHSADHVDILGNVDAVTDLLKIVTDFNVDNMEDQIVSDIERITKKINFEGLETLEI